jgi:hypothetical protein
LSPHDEPPPLGEAAPADVKSLHVAVLIVSFNGADDISRCLGALQQSTYSDFRVVVCENGGFQAFQRLRTVLPGRLTGGQPVELLLAPDNLGYAGGINYCLSRTEAADAYWILNPDTEPEPAALGALIERLLKDDCGAVGHDLVLSNGRLASLGGGRWKAWSARAVSVNHGKPRPARVDAKAIEERLDYIVGASMLVSAGFLARVGRMREDYFLYCEEVEWCLRAGMLGERLGYAPDALVLHAHGTATGGGGALRQRSRIATFLIERNRILVTRDLYGSRLPVVAPMALAHILLKYAKARAWRQIGHALSGWLAGVRNQRGRPGWVQGGGAG